MLSEPLIIQLRVTMKKSLVLLYAVGVLGVSGLAARPAQAQRVVDVTPGVNTEDVSADALISGVFDTQSGNIDVDSVQVYVNGQNVTSNSSITRNFFSYQPTQPLSPGQHQIQVEYSNTDGQRRVASWNFTVENPQPALAIDTVTHNATEPLAQDATLLTTINGTSGVQASVLLIEDGSVVRKVQAEEVSPGVYVASYNLTASNVSTETIAVGQLQRGDQKIFAAATQPVVITASTAATEVTDVEVDNASNPTIEPTDTVAADTVSLQPQFTSHSDGDEIETNGFTLVGRTQPNATVEIIVDSSTAVAGGFVSLGSSNLVDTTVTADLNGEFSVSVPAPLVLTGNTTYQIEASARIGDDVSPITRMTLEQE